MTWRAAQVFSGFGRAVLLVGMMGCGGGASGYRIPVDSPLRPFEPSAQGDVGSDDEWSEDEGASGGEEASGVESPGTEQPSGGPGQGGGGASGQGGDPAPVKKPAGGTP
jgi:hypothetical protein